MDIEELILSTCENTKPNAINLWNWKTSNSVFQYKNGGPVDHKLLSMLGNDYFIGGNNKEPKLYLWQVNNPDPVKKFRLILPDKPTCMSVCPHGYYLALGIQKDLYIWQLPSGKLLCIQRKNYQPITVVKISPCGQFVIVGGQDGLVNVYPLVDLVSVHKPSVGQTEPLYTLNHHHHSVTDIHIGNFGRKSRFATCSIDQTMRIYEIFTGKLLLNLVFQTQIHSVIFDSPCWNVYVGGSNGNLQTYKLIAPPRQVNYHITAEGTTECNTFDGHKSSVKCLTLNLSESILASGADDGMILIWDIASRQMLKKLEQNSPITNLKFILNHKNIFSQDFTVSIAVRDLEIQKDLDNLNFPVIVIRKIDLGERGNKCSEEENEVRYKLERENQALRAHNQQLHEFVLGLMNKK